MRKENIITFKNALYLIFVLGMAIRIYMAFVHFTHVDDLGAINAILRKEESGLNELEVAKNFWTYAPFQIVLSGILTNVRLGYSANIFLGRLPSLLSGILVLFLAYKLLDRLLADNNKRESVLLFCMILCGFSWENIIYSAQMEPYEILVLFSFGLLYSITVKFYRNWKSTLIATLFFTLGCYSHYQFFILVFAMYISLFIINIKKKQDLIRICLAGIGNVALTVPLLITMKNGGMFERSVNWNKGRGDCFLFMLPDGIAFWEKINYVLKFFSTNTFLIFKYFLTVNSFGVFSTLLTIILIGISLIGVIYLHKKYIELAVYGDILASVALVMIWKGTLTYGPSRHMLFVFPSFIILIAMGIACVFNNDKYERYVFLALRILGLGCIICFLFSLPDEIAGRKNYFSEKEINKLASEYSPDFIFGTKYTVDLYNMYIEGYNNLSDIAVGWCQKYDIDSADIATRFMMISRTTSVNDFLDRTEDVVFTENARSHGFDHVADQFPQYKVLFNKAVPIGREVEYASKYYNNYPNGLNIYILECAR